MPPGDNEINETQVKDEEYNTKVKDEEYKTHLVMLHLEGKMAKAPYPRHPRRRRGWDASLVGGAPSTLSNTAPDPQRCTLGGIPSHQRSN